MTIENLYQEEILKFKKKVHMVGMNNVAGHLKVQKSAIELREHSRKNMKGK